MLGGGQDTIPSINITTEFPSDSPSHSHHVLSSGLLSPHSPAHGLPSPVLSDLSDSGSVWNPSSPTLSYHSGPFPSTLQLRGREIWAFITMATICKLNPITVLDEPEPPFSVCKGTLCPVLAQNTTRYDVVKMWVVYLPQVILSDA